MACATGSQASEARREPGLRLGTDRARTAKLLVKAANQIGRPIFLIETGEHYESGFNNNDPWYPPSISNQRQFLLDLQSVVKAVPEQLGMGIEYWDPGSNVQFRAMAMVSSRCAASLQTVNRWCWMEALQTIRSLRLRTAVRHRNGMCAHWEADYFRW
jgi:hypothetical protein